MAEFVISPRARAALEKMGLVKVQYAGLDEALAGDDFQRLCAEHQLRPSVAAHATRLILDEMRQRMAVNHEVFTDPPLPQRQARFPVRNSG